MESNSRIIFICHIIILLFSWQQLLRHRVMFKKPTCLYVTGSPVSLICHIKCNNNWSLERIRQIDVDIQFKLMEPNKLHVCLYVPEMKTPNISEPVLCTDEERCFSQWKWFIPTGNGTVFWGKVYHLNTVPGGVLKPSGSFFHFKFTEHKL